MTTEDGLVARRSPARFEAVERAALASLHEARRIADAEEAGCEVLFTETGEALPGTPQHSFHNIQRAGFEAGPVRANRVLEA